MMKDLTEMMAPESQLTECQAELAQQFDAVRDHSYKMKLAFLMNEILDRSLDVLKGIDQAEFLDAIRTMLEANLNKAEEWKNEKNGLAEHLDRNRELLLTLDNGDARYRDLTDEITRLLDEQDRMIANMATDRIKRSIAEIEAMTNH